jgi:nucleoside-diphosphate-sugar epimerase
MMVALVLGASGATGRFLLPRLLEAGHDVVALSRRPRAGHHARLRWAVGDLDALMPDLPTLDAIFSLGPLDACARWFMRARVAGRPRLVGLSSMSAQTKRDSTDPRERDLAQRLGHAEQTLGEIADQRGCAWTLLRPTLIYGSGTDRSLSPIARLAMRWRVFPRLDGARGLRQPVHADDLAAACLASFVQPRSAGRNYALGGGERLGFDAMLERVRASLPVRTLPLPIPLGVVRTLAGIAPRLGLPALHAAMIERLTQDLVADHGAAIADFGWAPRGFHPDAQTWRPC